MISFINIADLWASPTIAEFYATREIFEYINVPSKASIPMVKNAERLLEFAELFF